MAIKDEYKKGYVNMRLNNVEVQWAKVFQPDDHPKYPSKWVVDIILPDDVAAALKALDFPVKDITRKDGTIVKNVLKAKKNVKTSKGVANEPPQVVGPDGLPWTEDIGNGSLCNINISSRAWDLPGGWAITVYLEGLQVVNHVSYGGGEAFTPVASTEGDVPF